MDPIRPVDRDPISPVLRSERRKPGERDERSGRRRRREQRPGPGEPPPPPPGDDEEGRPHIDVRA